MELIEIDHRLLAPLKSLPVLTQVLTQLCEVPLLDLFVQVADLVAPGHGDVDRVIRIDPDHVQLDSSRRVYDNVTFRVDLIDISGHADGKEAVVRHILTLLFLPAGQKDDAVVHFRIAPGEIAELFCLKIYICIRYQ